jgi:hypothetical protein
MSHSLIFVLMEGKQKQGMIVPFTQDDGDHGQDRLAGDFFGN